nr:transient receptor potential cation channel subfamily A member 1-like [Pocillopora verrucosa]
MPQKKRKRSASKGNAMEMKKNRLSRDRHYTLSINSLEKVEEEEVDKDVPKDRDSRETQLQEAAISGDVEVVEELISKGIAPSITDGFGRTPLHNAILGNQLRIVEILLGKGANVRVQDERGDTPIHTAVRAGNEKILKRLLQEPECDVNATGRSNVTPLHLAAGMDRVQVCKLLIEHQAKINNRDDDQMTPLGHGVERGAKDAVSYLFYYARSQKFDLDSFLYKADLDGSSLLHMAVDGGNIKIVELCLLNGSRVRCPKTSDKSTAFHLACAQGSMEIVKLLASYDLSICRITLLDAEGQTPLHRAATNNHVSVVEYLLDQGAAIDPPDKSRRTPLYQATSKGAVDTVGFLLKRGADVTVKTIQLRSVIHAAVPFPNVMELLLRVPSSAYLITDKDYKSLTPADYAAAKGQSKTISLLMETNKAAASSTSNELDTPLHIAAKFGWLPIVESLLVGRNVRMINLQNNKGMTPLHLACSEGNDLVVEYLMTKAATIEKDQNQKTALHLAASRGSKRCIVSILETHPECLNNVDENKNTALNLASFEGHAEIVVYLLSLKDQEILMNAYNQNVLDIALKEDKKNVAIAIAEHDRWREILNSSAPGSLLMMQDLVIKMPEVAEAILDQCVTEEGDQLKPHFRIRRDLTIIQPKYVPNPEKDQLTVLKTMVKYRRDKCLTHKVVFNLVHLKWKKFGFTSLIFSLFLYLTYLLSLTALAMYSRDNEKKICAPNDTDMRRDYLEDMPTTRSDMFIQVLTYVVLVLTLVHLASEVFQLLKKRANYLVSGSNYIVLTGYIITMLYIFPPNDCKSGFQIQIGALSLFFGWMNLILYLRKLSFLGSYVIMLATMFITLFKVLVLFLLFILAFGTTFYMLTDENESATSLPKWILTIFVMTLGELNYADNFMPWEYPFATLINTLFVLFVLAMPIILMNMLVGLAVGDIDNIQKNATMDRYVMQIKMLLETEEQLPRCLRKYVQFEKFVEYPNKKLPLKTRLYDAICGFGHPGGDENEKDEHDVPREIIDIKTKVEEQETKINEISNMLRKQSEMLEVLAQKSKLKEG